MGTPTPPLDRFMRKILCDVATGCWLWQGTRAGSTAQYGTFHPGTRQSEPKVYAHRWIYEQMVGPIPAETPELDHLCRVPLCVRPVHLEPVTHAENRRRARLTVCRAGLHDLTDPANVRWDGDGNRRGCVECWRAKARARYHRVKETR